LDTKIAANEPHCGNFALEFGPSIIDSRLDRNSYYPSRAVIRELDKEAGIKAAIAGMEDATRFMLVVPRCKGTNGCFI
jgi:hypothetical protein